MQTHLEELDERGDAAVGREDDPGEVAVLREHVPQLLDGRPRRQVLRQDHRLGPGANDGEKQFTF